ncbi:MAG: HEAT repeat domain-containing protein, partial [Gemmatimonadaceae bacterium]
YCAGEPVLAVLSGVPEVAARMRAGQLAEIEFAQRPVAGEILGLARALADVDPDHPEPDGLHHRLAELGATTLRFVRAGVAEAPDEDRESPTVLQPAGAPAVEAEVLVESAPEVLAEPTPASAAPAVAPEAAASPLVAGLVSQDTGGMFYQFSSVGSVKDSPEVLLGRLANSGTPAEAIRLLDDVVSLADTAAREGKPAAVVELLRGVIAQEASATDADVKQAYVMALRRLSKPLLLRAVAGQLTQVSEGREVAMAVLTRMGQDGAEAVIDQVMQAQTNDDRAALFQALTTLDGRVPALINMLGDARWFVARNAADLLGELQAAGAESALVELLRHGDERVRRAATNALMQLGSESARQAVREAVRDHSPQVRMQAAFAIAAHGDPKTATTLITAIDTEQDSDVQLAMLLALGRVGTASAVERLIRAAEPERGFFKKKSTAFRVAAVQALAEVKSSVAEAVLKSLASDREKEVRDTVARLTKKGRRSSSVP